MRITLGDYVAIQLALSGIGHVIGGAAIVALVLLVRDEIRAEIRASEIVPQGAAAIALGVARTTVAMRGPEDDNYFEDDIRRSRPKGSKRPPGTGVYWRMDYVATVASSLPKVPDSTPVIIDCAHQRNPSSLRVVRSRMFGVRPSGCRH